MSALSELVQKKDADRTALEKAVILYDFANEAADQLAALMVIVEATKAWHGYWPDEEDLHEAREEACQCTTCGLIRAVDALKGDA